VGEYKSKKLGEIFGNRNHPASVSEKRLFLATRFQILNLIPFLPSKHNLDPKRGREAVGEYKSKKLGEIFGNRIAFFGQHLAVDVVINSLAIRNLST
jgi:hypothetical protein